MPTDKLPDRQMHNQSGWYSDGRTKINVAKSESETNENKDDFDGEILSEFRQVTELEVSKLIRKSPSKSSALDPIPTWLLKQCLDHLVPAPAHTL